MAASVRLTVVMLAFEISTCLCHPPPFIPKPGWALLGSYIRTYAALELSPAVFLRLFLSISHPNAVLEIHGAAQFLVLSLFDLGDGGGGGFDHFFADLVHSERIRTTCRS